MAELGISLPPVVAPVATYVRPCGRATCFMSRANRQGADGSLMTGHLGAGVDVAAGAAAARVCALNILAQVAAALDGDLDRVVRVVKLVGFVASTPDFTDQPMVINGASDLLVEVLGEAGRHARSAVGVAALPLNVSVEVEAIFEVR